MAYGEWCMVYDACHMVKVLGAWYMLHGLWCLMHGDSVWCMVIVCGAWRMDMVYGAWHMAYAVNSKANRREPVSC
jgi:hypothetical protein